MNRDDLSAFRLLPDGNLPVFCLNTDDLTLFYAPGYLLAAREKEAAEIRGILCGEIPFGNFTAAKLIEAAVSAESTWAQIHSPSFYRPVCLTIYSSLSCNLNCSYCFAKEEHGEPQRLDHDFIIQSARKVLMNCQESESPFTVVFHGGGEPSLDPRMPELLTELKQMSAEKNVRFRSYMATNGVMGEEKARWIAEQFDEVGLSVDGPPDIQNFQRPQKDGEATADIVERTAAVFRSVKGRLTVRVTVLPENFRRIPDISAYCAEILHADEIRMEPVYLQGTDPGAADVFCERYLEAKKTLLPMNRVLSFSGSRPGEIHGRYCQIFRQVLHLVPPHGISPCFILSSQNEVEKAGADLTDHRELAAEDPSCLDCFNRYHCARGCPDICPVFSEKPPDAGSFRCRISRTLAEAELIEKAENSLFGIARRYGYAGMYLKGDA